MWRGEAEEAGEAACLCEGQPSLIVHLEDLLDGVDVGGRPQVETQVVLGGCAHDLLENGEENATLMTTFRLDDRSRSSRLCSIT